MKVRKEDTKVMKATPTCIEIEQETTHVFIINLSSSVSLILGDNLQQSEMSSQTHTKNEH